MIGPFRRQQVQTISFWLRGSISSRWTTPNQMVHEWACEMLSQCRSLHKLSIGVSEGTKDGRVGSGPVKVLDDLAGTGLKNLEIRVRKVSLWESHWVSVWDMQLDDQPESEMFLSWRW
jgi:hypothetical protein